MSLSVNDSLVGEMRRLGGINLDISGSGSEQRNNNYMLPNQSLLIPSSMANSAGFYVSHLNIRSLRSNFSQLISVLQALNYWPDVLILSEIWVFSEEVSCFSIPGYNCISSCNDKYRAGGIIVFSKECLKLSPLPCTLQTADTIQFSLTVQNTVFTFLCVYRLHSFSEANFVAEIGRHISSISCKNLMVIGDCNLDILLNSASALEYLQTMAGHGLDCLISEPTREVETLRGKSSTCIDHIFYRSFKTEYEAFVSEMCITDHHMISVKLNVVFSQTVSNAGRTRVDEDKFVTLFNSTDFSDLYTKVNVDDAYEFLLNSLNEAIQQATVPTRPARDKVLGKPWQSRDLNNLIKEKYKLIKQKSAPSFVCYCYGVHASHFCIIYSHFR